MKAAVFSNEGLVCFGGVLLLGNDSFACIMRTPGKETYPPGHDPFLLSCISFARAS